MDKSVHYTDQERMLLAQLISEEKAIENKKTGATNMKNKAEAWERITKKYASEGCTPRSNKQLRKCWDNI
ncbi:hypothetical protein EAI_16820 [Harpegnathos saltator]|uniref:Regulatory protein zeste n=1 Tax=Harpegnathos saltator TaxID=610380 RepID=E2C9H6_HARSA|nr:hypothetical protein EAI_16819 [Harpegnathos saltator]EFN75407.1 hypothetical protein EAI_16820 [Harpegnathos saltator]